MEEIDNLRSIESLKSYIETDFDIIVSKQNQSFLTFPSGISIHVRGSKILFDDKEDQYGFYGLRKNNYDTLLNADKSFFAIVYDKPEITFLIPKNALSNIFKNDLMTNKKNSLLWYFYVRPIDNKYYIDFRKKGIDRIEVTEYLNKWEQIEDIFEKRTKESHYFLIQVSDIGSKNIINNSFYEHPNWDETPRDKYHGMVRVGDILLIYFANSSIQYNKQIKKIYKVTQITENNVRFQLAEERQLNGLSFQQIKDAIKTGRLNSVFNKVGQEGFNIIKIDKSDYDSILLLDRNLNNQKEFEIFLTGYPEGNLHISKRQKILGWKENPKLLSIGDYVFIYNTTSKKIECGFKIKSKSNIQIPIWEDEINPDSSQQKYQFRWDADLICDNLNIDLKDISQIEPFKATNNNGKKANFGLLVGRNSPNSLRNAVYKPFKDYLISKCGTNSNEK